MVEPAVRRMLQRRHLDEWIVAAAKGLAHESYERVREEIADHFGEALEAGMAAGQSPDAAARQAVEALGPPRKARRAFRRTYLTTVEANLVQSFAREPSDGATKWQGWRTRSSRVAAGILVTFLSAAFVVFADSYERGPLVGALIVAIMSCGVVGLAVTPRIFRRGNQRAAVALGAVAETAIWSGYLLAAVRIADAVLGIGLALLLAALLYSVVRVLPKLPSSRPPNTRTG